MKLAILGWSSSGLRCPDIEIDLQASNQEPYAVTLLQMSNGTGKTTTLNLIRAALDGSALHWSKKDVREFKRAKSEDPEGRFSLRLAVDGDRLTFQLRLQFDTGEARYTTQYRGRNSPQHRPPPSLVRFLRTEFVQLFIFDGEFAERLFTPEFAEAQRAIESQFQLYHFDDLREAASRYLNDAIKESGTRTRGEQAVRQLRKDRAKAHEEAQRREQKLKDAQEKLKQHKNRIKELEADTDALKDRTQGLTEEEAAAEREKSNAARGAEDALRDLLETFRNPVAVHPTFGSRLKSLVDGLERLRLPAETASQWFDELASDTNANCVCGRALGAKERQRIRDHKPDYLGTEVHAVLNAIKRGVTTEIEKRASASMSTAPTLEDCLKHARDTEKRHRTATTAHRYAREKISKSGTDEERALMKEQLSLEPLIGPLEGLIKKLEDPNDEASVHQASTALERCEDELHKATETAELNSKIKQLRKILDDAKRRADQALRKTIRDECNKRLKTVLSSDPLQLRSIDRSLELDGQVKGSVGQNLAVGYTFLVTLLADGNHSFPLVVDSPTGPLDNTRRTRVAELIPEMSEQFLAFTISSERSGFVAPLVEAIKRRSGHDVQFLTLIKKTDKSAGLTREIPPSELTETDHAALVRGRDFFERFDHADDESK